MSELATGRPFPRGVLLGAAALVGCTLILAAVGRLGGFETAAPPSETVASRELRFEDRAIGGVSVVDAKEGREIAVFEPGEGGFIRGVLRSLVRARRLNGMSSEQPFRLVQHADGQLVLEDPVTDASVYLAAFGPTQVETFAKLMVADGAHP